MTDDSAANEQDDNGFGALDLLQVAGRLVAVVLRALFVGVTIAVTVLRSRENRHRARHWFLLEADRGTIVAGLVGGVFVASLVLGLTDVIGVRESEFVTTMFSTIIAGLFSFVPLVVTINQLTVSRVIGTPERLREQVADVNRFRDDVEAMAPVDVSTTDPAGFLWVLFRAVGERATALEATCADCPSGTIREEVTEFAASVDERAAAVCDRVDDGGLRLWTVLLPVLNHNYSADCNRARRIQTRDELPPDAEDLLDDLRELFVSVDVTRQYFKSMYLQQELAHLSRLIAYSGVAAFLVSTLVIMIYATGYPPIVDEFVLLVLVTVTLAIAFSPFAILFAYVVRVATVLKRTSAPGAFTPPGERPPHARDRFD